MGVYKRVCGYIYVYAGVEHMVGCYRSETLRLYLQVYMQLYGVCEGVWCM